MTTEPDDRVAEVLAALRDNEEANAGAPRTGCRSIALFDGTTVLAYYGDGSKPGFGYEYETEEQRQRRAGEEDQTVGDWDVA